MARKPWADSDRRQHLPSDWRALRLRRFALDGYRCTQTLQDGSRCKEVPTECDHLGDRTDHRIEMLTSLCSRHHGIKTSRQGRRAAARNRRKQQSKFLRTEQHPGLL